MYLGTILLKKIENNHIFPYTTANLLAKYALNKTYSMNLNHLAIFHAAHY
jgi:hypothetical protein